MWLWWLACTGSPSVGDQCAENRPCAWGQVCVLGQCQQGGCATSAQCPIGSYCTEGQCLTGCRQEADCAPGTTCDLGLQQCVDAPCRDTHVDCGFGEYCDTETGVCFDAGERFCQPCELSAQCDGLALCFADHCTVSCDESECPAGFDCVPFDNSLGEVITYQCIAYCNGAP